MWASRWLSGKESTCQSRRLKFDRWVRRIPWRGKWHPTPVSLPGKSHGQRSLVGYSLWRGGGGGHKKTDMTWQLNIHEKAYFTLNGVASKTWSSFIHSFIRELTNSYMCQD